MDNAQVQMDNRRHNEPIFKQTPTSTTDAKETNDTHDSNSKKTLHKKQTTQTAQIPKRQQTT